MGEESQAQLKRRPFSRWELYMVGSLLLVPLITSMSGRGKGASGPVGKESTFPGHLLSAGLPIVSLYSFCRALLVFSVGFPFDLVEEQPI